jgi:hypothetical protein
VPPQPKPGSSTAEGPYLNGFVSWGPVVSGFAIKGRKSDWATNKGTESELIPCRTMTERERVKKK